MPRWLIFTLLLGLMVFPAAVSAQGGTKLETINIELWSEFDKPSMLVISEFVVSQDTALPAKVTMRFPKEGNLIAVASERNGGLFNSDFEGPVEQENWQTITMNVQSYDPHRVEYYQPLMRAGDQRQFTYQWFGDYYVKQFDLNMLVPADSTNLVTTPPLSNTEISIDNLHLIGTVSQSSMKMGQSFEFDLKYERSSDALANPNQTNQVQPSEPIGPNTAGRVSVNRLPWLIGGMGLALIIIALWAYWRSTQSSDHKPRRRRASHVKEGQADQIYCHECGARAHASDRFCRTCGSRLRVE
jgi:hypothetical protein